MQNCFQLVLLVAVSYHVLTLQTPNTRLSVDKASLVATHPETGAKRMPIEDIRAVVVATHQVSFSNECLAQLLESNVTVLHCNRQFKPVGWSVGVEQVVERKAFINQVTQPKDLQLELWRKLLEVKFNNQAWILDNYGVNHSLHDLKARILPNEANIAKQFWKHYFNLLGATQTREKQGATRFENQALNYGYAVIATLIYRAVLLHGLLPNLGIHHQVRYRSHPLVYDLQEPFRGFVEYLLAEFILNQLGDIDNLDDETRFKEWIMFLTQSLRDLRVKIEAEKHSFKLMDAVDKYVNSVARCFEHLTVDKLWLPSLQNAYWFNTNSNELDSDNDEE